MREEKGITLISLIITIVILTILSFSISIGANTYIERKRYTNFQSDITILIEKVEQYYANNKKIPIINKFVNTSMIKDIKNINDNENYYVINLAVLKNVTLNYGKDYDIIKNKNKSEEINDLLDVYIINEQSHTIYYPKGIEYYKQIIYSDTNNYSNIQYENVSEILTYRKTQEYVTKNIELKDSKQNKIILPKGFKIAEDSGLTVDEGIIIEDNDKTIDGTGKSRGNQFVWIPIGQIVKSNNEIEIIQLNRCIYNEDGTVDPQNLKTNPEDKIIQESNEFIEGLKDSKTNNSHALDIQEFLKSANENRGYYIARYESSYGIDGKPNSKISTSYKQTAPTEEGQLWNNITQNDAVNVSRSMYNDPLYKVDLINSFAWDTAIEFIQKCSNDIKYSRQNSLNTQLGNTGRTDNTKDEMCKINDMASNATEWTTETSNNSEQTCTHRGGSYKENTLYTSIRNINGITNVDNSISFRTIIYL